MGPVGGNDKKIEIIRNNMDIDLDDSDTQPVDDEISPFSVDDFFQFGDAYETQLVDFGHETQVGELCLETQPADGCAQVDELCDKTQQVDLVGYTQVDELCGGTQQVDQAGYTQVDELCGGTQQVDLAGYTQVDELCGGNQRLDLVGYTQVDELCGETQQVDLVGFSQVDLLYGETQQVDLVGYSQVYELCCNTQQVDLGGHTQVVELGDQTEPVDLGGETQVLYDSKTEVSVGNDNEGGTETEFCDTQLISSQDSAQRIGNCLVDPLNMESTGLNEERRKDPRTASDSLNNKLHHSGSALRGFASIRAASIRASGLAARNIALKRNKSSCYASDNSIELQNAKEDGIVGIGDSPKFESEYNFPGSQKNNMVERTEYLELENECEQNDQTHTRLENDEHIEYKHEYSRKFGSSTARKLFMDDGASDITDLPQVFASENGLGGLSYVNSQEPGELSQANALETVEKIITLNNVEEVSFEESAEGKSKKPISSTKGTQSLAKKTAARMREVENRAYTWDDNLEDEGGGDFFQKHKEVFFASKKSKSLDPSEKSWFQNSKIGTMPQENGDEEHLNKGKQLKDAVLSDTKQPSCSLSLNDESREESIRKNLTRELDEENDKDAPDMLNVGLDTQLAADAMENLRFAGSVVDNDGNEGMGSLRNNSCGQAGSQSNVKQNLHRKEACPIGAGVITRHCKRARTSVESHKELSDPSSKQYKNSKKDEEINAASGDREADGSNDKDAPNMLDVGLDTQIAADAMESLRIVASVADNDCNEGKKSLRNNSCGEADGQSNIKQNLHRKESNIGAGVITRQRMRARTVVESHKELSVPSCKLSRKSKKHKEINAASGDREADGSNDKDAPDTLDVGLDTQIAANAMESLRIVASVADNDCNEGKKSLRNNSCGEADGQSNIKQNLHRKESNIGAGVITRQCMRARTVVESHKELSVPSSKLSRKSKKHKEINAASGDREADGSNDKDAPDTLDVGLDTQIAADAMEGLRFGGSVADNDGNEGMESLRNKSRGEAGSKSNIKQNLHLKEACPIGAGVSTRQCKRARTVVELHKELSVSSLKLSKSSKKKMDPQVGEREPKRGKLDQEAFLENMMEKNLSNIPKKVGRPRKDKIDRTCASRSCSPKSLNNLATLDQNDSFVPVAHRTRKSLPVNHLQRGNNLKRSREHCDVTDVKLPNLRGHPRGRRTRSRFALVGQDETTEVNKRSKPSKVDTLSSSTNANVKQQLDVSEGRSICSSVDRNTCIQEDLVQTKTSNCSAVNRSKDNKMSAEWEKGKSNPEASSKDGYRSSALEIATPINCTATVSDASPICKGDEYLKQSCRKNLLGPSISREVNSLLSSGLERAPAVKDTRRRRDMTAVRVLFSRHLDADIIKQQKKILNRLGASIASSMSDASHFVTDEFVRTNNMLEAIAFGKPVVTHLWLESCGEASCFIDERSHILRDAKKEKEFGFNMPVSLARACQNPLLQGHRVFITPNKNPGKEILASLVKAVHGLVVERLGRSLLKDENFPDDLLVLSCEEDYDICVPILEKGASVYSSELLLNGIVTQRLDYERHKLFSDSVKRTRSTLWLKGKDNVYIPVCKGK